MKHTSTKVAMSQALLDMKNSHIDTKYLLQQKKVLLLPELAISIGLLESLINASI